MDDIQKLQSKIDLIIEILNTLTARIDGLERNVLTMEQYDALSMLTKSEIEELKSRIQTLELKVDTL